MAKTSKDQGKTAPKPVDRGFGYQVIRLAELLEAHAESVLAPLELKPRAYEAMLCIVNGQGLSQQDLSRKLGVYAPQMVGLLDGLESRGLIERQISATDRRRRALSVTPSGREMLKRGAALLAPLDRELFGDVTDAEKERFAVLVRRLEAQT